MLDLKRSDFNIKGKTRPVSRTVALGAVCHWQLCASAEELPSGAGLGCEGAWRGRFLLGSSWRAALTWLSTFVRCIFSIVPRWRGIKMQSGGSFSTFFLSQERETLLWERHSSGRAVGRSAEAAGARSWPQNPWRRAQSSLSWLLRPRASRLLQASPLPLLFPRLPKLCLTIL